MEYLVPAEEDGKRLRDVLRRCMQLSYTAMKSAKWSGGITVNGEVRTVDRPVFAGEIIAVHLPEGIPVYTPKPYALPLRVPYEDEYLMVVDKPAPLASQSSEGFPDNSLENAVYAYWHCPAGFIYRPVNRLDKGTSGLMVIAKDPHTQHLLQKQLHTEDFTRTYLAVTDGVPPKGADLIDAPIAKENAASIRRIVTETGRPSQTAYQVLRQTDDRALVHLQLFTGRTHQIRVHMAYVGCPVFGDFLYGQERAELPGRFALHSHTLRLKHPHTGKILELVSPLPESLNRLLQGDRDTEDND